MARDKLEEIKAAIATGNIALYDESMDDPSDRRPWTIAIPGSFMIADFREEAVARTIFDILKSKSA